MWGYCPQVLPPVRLSTHFKQARTHTHTDPGRYNLSFTLSAQSENVGMRNPMWMEENGSEGNLRLFSNTFELRRGNEKHITSVPSGPTDKVCWEALPSSLQMRMQELHSTMFTSWFIITEYAPYKLWDRIYEQ